MAGDGPQTGYAPVNGLQMYYEIHGSGQPLVVLHGSFMSIDLMGPVVQGFATTRQVIAVELQGHGRTADVAREITYESLADDTAALVRHLGIGQVDVFGYSLGGGVALQMGIRHPDLIRKLVSVSAYHNSDGLQPGAMEAFEQTRPEMFDGPWRDAYNRLAPDPNAFPSLVEKLKRLDLTPLAWPEDAIRAIKAPTMVVLGDADGTRLEHAVELFKLRGGGAFGDLAPMPASQLAVLPGTTHIGMLGRADWLLLMVPPFLDAPLPEPA